MNTTTTRRTFAALAAAGALTLALVGCSPSTDATPTPVSQSRVVVLNGAECDQCSEQVQRWEPDGSFQRVTKWDDGSFSDERWEPDHTYTRTTTVGVDTTTYEGTWSK
ncbi:MAG TPA: hypothetical protein VFJ14_14520 [Nocardioidaceae bacterium]|jgi:hypothetical protein|nr:hypothetical protein [Nocardioidaceae bacterium]